MKHARNPSGGQWIGLALGGIGGWVVGGIVGGMGAIAIAAAMSKPNMTGDDEQSIARVAAGTSLALIGAGVVSGAIVGYHAGSK